MYDHERSLVQEMQGKPFALIGVNSDGDQKAIRKIVEEKNLIWRSFWNGPKGTGGPIATEWNIRGWPSIFILDAKGVIRFRDARGEAMNSAVKKLLKDVESGT